MARLFKRPRSPFFYIEYKAANGIVRESTKFEHRTREGQRAAHRLLTKRAAEEKAAATLPRNSAWDRWVIPFLKQHCVNSKATLTRYLGRWNILRMFLRTERIGHPCQLTYAACQRYVDWRTDDRDVDRVSQNTARDDLVTLSLIMREAVRRDFAMNNPCSQLRLKTAPRRERIEISDADAAVIRAELATGKQLNGFPWPAWMKIQFEIGWYTGRRISETKIALRDLDLVNGTYTVKVKGGKIKTKPFHPALLPTLQGIQGTHTHNISATHSTRMWRDLFRQLKMPYTFHCLRVSFVSRCRRSGIDRWTALQLCDHASTVVHEHYNRYGEADLRSALAKLEFPKTDSNSSAPPQP